MKSTNGTGRYREEAPERRRDGTWKLSEQSKEETEDPWRPRERRPWTDEEIRRALPIQERLRNNLLREEGYCPTDSEPIERDPEAVWKEKERLMFGQAGSGSGSFGFDGADAEKGARRIGRTVRIQLAASLVLFAAVWGVFHTESPKTEPARQAVRDVLTKEWNFTAVSAWYEKRFGTLPSFLPAFHSKEGNDATEAAAHRAESFAVPAQGAVSSSFADQTPWISLATAVGTPVMAIDDGMVTYAGEQADGGLTLSIRHTGGMESTYTGLDELKLTKGDWVQKGETIGRVARNAESGQGLLRFAVMKDGLYVNPVEWVHFD